MPQVDLSSALSAMNGNYRQVADIASGESAQQTQQQQQQQQLAPENMREMNAGERFFAGLANVGKAMAGGSNFAEYYNENGGLASLLTPEGIGRFALNLPSGMASALPTGFANLYAGATGSNVTYGADVDRGLIDSEQLDLGQRAASLVTGGIDTLGLLSGGSGSLLSEGARAIRAGKSLEAARNVGNGLITSGAGLANRGVMTTGQAFAFDVAEEAGEEFVQSWSEDVIQKQLDDGTLGRALEGGFMGALGGAMMSGPAMGLRAMTNRDRDKATSSEAARAGNQQAVPQNPYAWMDEIKMSNAGGINNWTSNAQQYAEEKAMKDYVEAIPGSGLLMFTSSGRYDGFTMGINIADLRAIADRNQESFQTVYNWAANGNDQFTVDMFKNLLYSKREVQAAKDLWQAVKSNYDRTGEVPYAALKRDPATDGGTVLVYIAGIDAGGPGLDMSGLLAKSVGGDYDSDKGSIILDLDKAKMHNMPWAHDTLLKDEDFGGTKPRTKYEYGFSSMKYTKDKAYRREIVKRVRRNLDNLQSSLAGHVDYRLTNENVKRLMDAFLIDPDSDSGKDGQRDAAISQALLQLRRSFDEAGLRGDGAAGRRAIDEAMRGFGYRKEKRNPRDMARYAVDRAIRELDKKFGEGGNRWVASAGRTSPYGTMTKPWEQGYPEAYTAENRNQLYRSYATYTYQHGKTVEEQKLFDEFAKSLGYEEGPIDSAFGFSVIFGMKLVEAGDNPSDAIVGLVCEYIKLEYADELGKIPPESVTTKTKIDLFQRIYRKYAKIKNDAMKVLSDDLYVTDFKAAKWDTELDYSKNAIGFAREFLRVFSEEDLEFLVPNRYFGIGLGSLVEGQTLAKSVEDAARLGLDYTGLAFKKEDPDLYKLYGDMIIAERSMGKRVESTLRGILEKFELEQVMNRFSKNGGNLDILDVEAMLQFTKTIEYFLYPKAASQLGFIDPANWMKTTIGQKFTSRERDEQVNAAVMMNFGAKFENAIREAMHGTEFSNDTKKELEMLRQIDGLHAYIVDELYAVGSEYENKGLSKTLQTLVDPNLTFGAKQDFINNVFGASDPQLVDGLVMSSMKQPQDAGRLNVEDSILTQLRQCRAPISAYRRALIDSCLEEVNDIKSKYLNKSISANALVQAFTEQVLFASTEITLTAAANMMADVANVSNHQPEKGSTIRTAHHNYMKADYADSGIQTAAIVDQFSTPMGVAVLEDVLNNPRILLQLLGNPKYKLKAWSVHGGQQCVLLSQDAIFRAVCGDEYKGGKPSALNIITLLEAAPALVTYLGGIGTTSRDSVGGGQDVPARTGKFIDAIQNVPSRRIDGGLEYKYVAKLEIQKVKNALLTNDIRTLPYIYSCLSVEEQAAVARGEMPSISHIDSILTDMARGWYAMRALSSTSIDAKGNKKIKPGTAVDQLLDRYYDDAIDGLTRFSEVMDQAVARSLNERLAVYDLISEDALESISTDRQILATLNELFPDENDPMQLVILQAEIASGIQNVESFAESIGGMMSPTKAILGIDLAVADAIGGRYMVRTQKLATQAIMDKLERFKQLDTTIDYGMETADLAKKIFDKMSEDSLFKLTTLPSELWDSSIDEADRLAKLDEVIKTMSYDVVEDRTIYDNRGKGSAYKELVDEYKKIPLGGSEKDVAPFILLFHSYEIRRLVGDYQSWANGNANPYIARDYYEASQYVHELFENPRYASLFDDTNVLSNADYAQYLYDGKTAEQAIQNFPVPDFSNRNCAMLHRQMVEAVASGRVVSEVSTNGRVNNELAGIDSCPIRPLDVVTGQQMSGQDLRAFVSTQQAANNDSVLRQYVRKIGQNGALGQPETIGDILGGRTADPLDPAANYEVFDPVRNPHGVCLGPVMASALEEYGSRYRGPITVLNRFMMLGIENFVLKVRKDFGADGDFTFTRIRNGRSIYDDGKDSIDITSAQSAKDAYESFIKYATHKIFDESIYQKDLKKENIGEAELMGIVQMMTVGIDVTYTDADDKTRHRTIDVKHLYDNTWDVEIRSIQGTVVSGSILTVPLTVVSQRIEDATGRLADDATDAEFDDAAWDAMTNWDGYVAEQLNVRDVLKMIRPLGMAYDKIRGERDFSAMQKLWVTMNEIVPGAFSKNGNTLVSEHSRWRDTLIEFTEEGGRIDTAEQRVKSARSYVAGHIARPVAISEAFDKLKEASPALAPFATVSFGRVFGNDYNMGDDKHRHITDMLKSNLETLSSDSNIWHAKGDSVLVLTSDRRELARAVSYAIASNSDIYIPKNFYHGKTIGTYSVTLQFDTGDNRSPKTVEMLHIKNNRLTMAPGAFYDSTMARVMIADPNETFFDILLDKDGTFTNQGDSVMWMLREVAKRFSMVGEDKVDEVDLDKFLETRLDDRKKRLVYQSLSLDEIKSLASLDPGNDEGWRLFDVALTRWATIEAGLHRDGGTRGFRRSVIDCAKKMQEVGGNGIGLSGMGNNSCVTIVKVLDTLTGDVVQYIPVFHRGGEIASGAPIYASGQSRVFISYAERIDLAGKRKFGTTFKDDSIDEAAGKVMVTTVNDFRVQNCNGFHAVINADTLSGRMKGRDTLVFRRSLGRRMLTDYMHWLLEPTSDGKYKYAEWFENIVGTKTNGEDYLRNTLNGNMYGDSLWSDILSGKNPLGISRSNGSFGKILETVVRQARDYNVPIMAVFGAANFFQNDDGTISFTKKQPIVDVDMAFDGLSFTAVNLFYNNIGSQFRLVQSPFEDTDAASDNMWLYNNVGEKMVLENSSIVYRSVLTVPMQYMGHAASVESVGNAATEGLQQRLNKQAQYGKDTSDLEFSIGYARARAMRPDAFGITNGSLFAASWADRQDAIQVSAPLFNDWRESKQLRELKREHRVDLQWRRTIVKNGKDREPIEYGKDDDGVSAAVEKFRSATGWSTIDLYTLGYLVNHQDGATRGNGENETMSAGQFCAIVDQLIKNFRKSGGTAFIMVNPNMHHEHRISIPTIDEGFVDLMCSQCSTVTKDSYVEEMWRQEANAISIMNKLNAPAEKAKQGALRKAIAAQRLAWNDPAHPWNEAGYIFGSLTLDEIADADAAWGMALQSAGFDAEQFMRASEQGKQLIDDVAKKLHNEDSRKKLEKDTYFNGPMWAGPSKTKDVVTKTMKTTISYARLASILSPGVFVGNVSGKIINGTIMETMLDFGQTFGLGPFTIGSENAFSSDFMETISGSDAFNKTWNALKHMALVGEDISLIAGAESNVDLMERIEAYQQRQGKANSFITGLFDFANGGNFMWKTQSRLFFKRLVHFMSFEPALQGWFTRDPQSGKTLLEIQVLGEGPEKFLLNCFNQNGHPELYECAQKAMNSALEYDFAQRHWMASWLNHLADRSTVADFIITMGICKFPRYQFNLMNKYLNLFLPMATIDRALASLAQFIDEKYAEKHEGYTPYHFELDQRFVNTRESLAYDATHMGTAALCGILLSIGNAIEPPDDEDKWGDPDEWLICGHRVGESWWMTDVLGAFWPVVLFVKSIQLGKFDMSILLNGTLSACSGNPFLRASDAANILVDWDDGVGANYAKDLEAYADAPGGAPGFLDWLQTNAAVGGANMLTNMFVPSFLREWYRNSEEYEKSYKRVYQTTSTGKLSEKGEKGYTEKTSFFDASVRKACRNNPMLAWIMNQLNPDAGTGYALSQMPDTLYVDDYQRAEAEKWSISGLDEEEAHRVMWNIFTYMNTHTVDQMKENGFYLDRETLYAFGSCLWDSYYAIEDNWNQMGQQGLLSYTYLGNGDYEEGKKLYYELLDKKNADKKLFYDMYYEKVKGSYLNEGMQQYKSYATSYRTDANGKLYATGMHRQGILPFLSAPGTTTNPEGTAGYENDFMSVSAVTGQPLSRRALIPVESDSMELPTFEGFSKNGDGKAYSGKWSRYSSTSGVDGSSNDSNAGNGGTTSSGTRYTSSGYRSSGSGGGTRRSSGSSYTPGISSRNYTPNAPSASTANVSRSYGPNLDYLRPGVQTKGSRDAYKRGDM